MSKHTPKIKMLAIRLVINLFNISEKYFYYKHLYIKKQRYDVDRILKICLKSLTLVQFKLLKFNHSNCVHKIL